MQKEKISLESLNLLLNIKSYQNNYSKNIEQITILHNQSNKNITKNSFYSILLKTNIINKQILNDQSFLKQFFAQNGQLKLQKLKNYLFEHDLQKIKKQIKKRQQKNLKKQIATHALGKLKRILIIKENALKLMRQFDENNDGCLNQEQLDLFLIGTDIRQFQNKKINKYTRQSLLYYMNTQNPNIQQIHRFFFTDQIQPKKINQSLKTKQQQTSQADMSLLITSLKEEIYKFKYCLPYLNRQIQNQEQFAYVQKLQHYLKFNIEFRDEKNPICNKGQYINASKIFNGTYQLFTMAPSILVRQISRLGIAQYIQPKDVIQGKLGDCYFMSSIASIISKYPQVIQKIFYFKKNPANYYALKLYINGQQKIITTDSFFSCDKSNQPVNAKYHTKQIWVMLLEKCWAKVFGNYKNIESGNGRQAFNLLSGAPCQVINQNRCQQNEYIKKIKKSIQSGYVLTTSTTNNLKKEILAQMGLQKQHQYSILKLLSFDQNLLFKLRNPWGTKTWKGEWSFKCSKWTKQLRKTYHYQIDPQDGSFYINLDNFLKYFNQTVICKINPKYQYSYIKAKSKKNKSLYLKIKVQKSGVYMISNHQKNKRFVPNPKDYLYSFSRLIIMKHNKNEFQYIKSAIMQYKYMNTMQLTLQKGQYIISSKIKWKYQQEYDQVISVYGVQKVKFQKIENAEIASYFREQLIKSYFEKYKQFGESKIMNNNIQCYTYMNKTDGIGFINIINKTKISFTPKLIIHLENIKLFKPYKVPLQCPLNPKQSKCYGMFGESLISDYCILQYSIQ